MADDADRADGPIQQMIDAGRERARRHAARQLPAIGVCHWCESPVDPGRTFCSKECCDDWDHDRQRRKDMGL